MPGTTLLEQVHRRRSFTGGGGRCSRDLRPLNQTKFYYSINIGGVYLNILRLIKNIRVSIEFQ